MLKFFVPCHPPTVTAQQKGVCATKSGKIRFFKKASVKAAENSLHALLFPHRPDRPFSGPLTLVVDFRFPWRKSESNRRRGAFALYPIETRPDVDNIFKGLADVMTTLGFWNDDGQISSLTVGKHYSEAPGIGITLSQSEAVDIFGRLTAITP